MSDYPKRCQHIKVNGVQCGSPALRRNRFCFFHKRFHDERIRLGTDNARRRRGTCTLPVLEDANSIQVALMEVMRLLLSGQVEHKTASLLLYALQTASGNLRHTIFSPNEHLVILDPAKPPSLPCATALGKTASSKTTRKKARMQNETAEKLPCRRTVLRAGFAAAQDDNFDGAEMVADTSQQKSPHNENRVVWGTRRVS